jgi:hypothetical protein
MAGTFKRLILDSQSSVYEDYYFIFGGTHCLHLQGKRINKQEISKKQAGKKFCPLN